MNNSSSIYTGRFAPSPSGPLHFGSLVAALASYLDARANHGRWLVRMEDIDPPREPSGTADQILRTLEAYGLQWDDSVLFQSDRSEAYQAILDNLLSRQLLYPCTCTRKQLADSKGVYPSYCRDNTKLPDSPYSLRLKCPDKTITFHDLIQGQQTWNLYESGDFILKRKDQLFAYQLAVSVDDAFQGITHVIRGCDLLDSTPRQLHLQHILGYSHPDYGHIPVITLHDGNKLSKQNHAPAIPLDNPRPSLVQAMKALGMMPEKELSASTIEDILTWGVKHWNLNPIKKAQEIPLASL